MTTAGLERRGLTELRGSLAFIEGIEGVEGGDVLHQLISNRRQSGWLGESTTRPSKATVMQLKNPGF